MADEIITGQGQEPETVTAGGQEPQLQNTDFEAQIKALKSEAAKYRIEAKKAKEEAENEKNKALTEQGQFKELYEKSLEKVKELETLSSFKEKYETLETSLRTQLLEQIPAGRRKDYESFPIDVLQVVVKDLQVKPTPSVGTEGKSTITSESKWDDLDESQKNALYAANPKLAEKLIHESIYSR